MDYLNFVLKFKVMNVIYYILFEFMVKICAYKYNNGYGINIYPTSRV